MQAKHEVDKIYSNNYKLRRLSFSKNPKVKNIRVYENQLKAIKVLISSK